METKSGPEPAASHVHRHTAHDEHGHACDCAAHRGASRVAPKAGGVWASLAPLLVCAVCPTCLAAYAKALSVIGVSVGLSELQHTVLLVTAITVSLAVSGWRSRRLKRAWPMVIAVLGSLLVLTGHFAGELHVAEWAGVLTLLAGGVTEQVRLRRASSQVAYA